MNRTDLQPNNISGALLQTKIAKIFLRLALAINGIVVSSTDSTCSPDASGSILPQFSISELCRKKPTDLCSLEIQEPDECDESGVYSDNIYGHVWIPSRNLSEKVLLMNQSNCDNNRTFEIRGLLVFPFQTLIYILIIFREMTKSNKIKKAIYPRQHSNNANVD